MHEAGKRVQRRIARDHQHRKGRLGAMRGLKTLRAAPVLRAGHALRRSPRGGFHELGNVFGVVTIPHVPTVVRAWDAVTADPLTR